MGCNQSKQEDIKKDNEQRARAAPPPTAGGTPSSTPTRPIGTPVQEIKDDNLNLGQSFTDVREGEVGYFKDIVERTAQNFIDVSVTNQPLEQDIADRSRDFSNLHVEAKVLASLAFITLPKPSYTVNISSLSSVPPMSPNNLDFMSSCSQAVTTSLQNMHVTDCGDLVIPFPEVTV